jgi:hypothetical protein
MSKDFDTKKQLTQDHPLKLQKKDLKNFSAPHLKESHEEGRRAKPEYAVLQGY